MHILLWMNVMLDFISMFSPSCEGRDGSENAKWNYMTPAGFEATPGTANGR